MDCGRCGRPIHEQRPACLYCGWAPSAFASSAEGGLLSPEEAPREYRCGAFLARFVFWSILCAGSAWITATGRVVWPWLTVAFLLFGPVAFVPYLVRALRVRVIVDPADGLVLSSGRFVMWEEIASVEARGLRFQPDYWLFNQLRDFLRALPLLGDFGLLTLALYLMAVGLSALLLVSGLLSGLMVPVCVMLSPWQPKVVLTFRDGTTKVWRDLSGDLDFVRAVSEGLDRRR